MTIKSSPVFRCSDDGVAFPPLWIGQVSIAGSAIATLQKELSSSSSRKIIKTVKSPSPSLKVVRTSEMLESIPPPFKESIESYRSGTQIQTGVAYMVGMDRVYEDWRAKVCSVAWWDGSEQNKKTWCVARNRWFWNLQFDTTHQL